MLLGTSPELIFSLSFFFLGGGTLGSSHQSGCPSSGDRPLAFSLWLPVPCLEVHQHLRLADWTQRGLLRHVWTAGRPGAGRWRRGAADWCRNTLAVPLGFPQAAQMVPTQKNLVTQFSRSLVHSYKNLPEKPTLAWEHSLLSGFLGRYPDIRAKSAMP